MTIKDFNLNKHMLRLFCVVISLYFSSISLHSNAEEKDSLSYSIDFNANFSGGKNTPFWLVSNLQGIGSPRKNNGYIRAGIFRHIDKSRKFSWGAGADLVGGWRLTAPFSIHQLYAEAKYRCLNALIGSKEIWGDFTDHRLSSGNLLYSGNAMPIPQIRLGIFDYADFWGTNGWFGVKGYLAFGMFTDSKWQKDWVNKDFNRTKNVLYHSKGLWLRGGNASRFPLTGEVGIEMATQFGGTLYVNGKKIHMPHSLKDWVKAVFPTKGDPSTPEDEQTNVQGNMLGSYYISLSWMPKADWSVKAYFQHYFEDHSQMTFEYGWKDGLWGVEVQLPRNRFVSSFVYEYLASKDQSGAVLNNSSELVPEQVSGRDNYYTNYLYAGWQHWGMGIGNPLIISPIYNANHRLTFVTTRILAHHFGFSGNPTESLSYRVLLSYSRNWGTYTRPLPDVLSNVNGLVEVSWKPEKLKGWHASFAVAGDAGRMLGKSLGFMINIGKTGSLNF